MILIGNKQDLVNDLKDEAAKIRKLNEEMLPLPTGRSDRDIRRRQKFYCNLSAAVAYEHAAEMAEALRSMDGPSSEELMAQLRAGKDKALAETFDPGQLVRRNKEG